jgi:uncharacterized protein (DUF362 family)
MGIVSVTKTNNGIKQSVVKAIELIGGIEKYISRTDKIMLKPNLNGTEGLTNIELVESLIQLLLDFGAKDIIIAESTFGNAQITDMCFEKSGYSQLAKKYNIKLINLNKSKIIEIDVKNPLVVDKLKIAKEVFEVDKIINLPVMKVHYATGITLSMKNLKGLLVGNEKKHFHEAGLDKAIVDLNNTIKPALNIVDCTACMERMGPRGGDIVNLNLLLAGRECAEVDYVGCLIMQHTLDDVKYLKMYIEQNNIDINAIEVVGENVDSVKYPFKKAQMDIAVPPQAKIHNINACSACMNALLLSFQFLEKGIESDVDVYLGSKLNKKDIARGLKIAFGNCCFYGMDFDIKIKGCPPYPFDLKAELEKHNASKNPDT